MDSSPCSKGCGSISSIISIAAGILELLVVAVEVNGGKTSPLGCAIL